MPVAAEYNPALWRVNKYRHWLQSAPIRAGIGPPIFSLLLHFRELTLHEGEPMAPANTMEKIGQPLGWQARGGQELDWQGSHTRLQVIRNCGPHHRSKFESMAAKTGSDRYIRMPGM